METTKTIIRSPLTGDSYTQIRHKSGLNILVCEMDGFQTTQALFCTNYGSIHTRFKTADDADFCTVPEGIAHFLEHKLFENEDCDVFDLYAKTGANANAFTSFDKTCYFFDCSDHFQESLDILLSFVQSPYFTPESVAKEQGIIGQEIRMYDDDPGWRVFFNMLENLYHSHPVRIDIAGTVESIAQITDDLLYRCYRTFYNLHNMVLVVAGKCTVDQVLESADRLLKPCKDQKLETNFPDEPDSIVSPEVTENAAVGQPLFHLGFKCTPRDDRDCLKQDLIATLTNCILLSSSSPLYQSMLQDGIINSSFSFENFYGSGYFTVFYSGSSDHPKAIRERITAAFAEAAKTGLDEELFQLHKKATYGDFVRSLNNVSSVASSMLSAAFLHCSPYDTLDILSAVTIDDCNRFLREELRPDRMVLSTILPTK